MGNGASVNSKDISVYDNPGFCDVGENLDLTKENINSSYPDRDHFSYRDHFLLFLYTYIMYFYSN